MAQVPEIAPERGRVPSRGAAEGQARFNLGRVDRGRVDHLGRVDRGRVDRPATYQAASPRNVILMAFGIVDGIPRWTTPLPGAAGTLTRATIGGAD